MDQRRFWNDAQLDAAAAAVWERYPGAVNDFIRGATISRDGFRPAVTPEPEWFAKDQQALNEIAADDDILCHVVKLSSLSMMKSDERRTIAIMLLARAADAFADPAPPSWARKPSEVFAEYMARDPGLAKDLHDAFKASIASASAVVAIGTGASVADGR